MVFLIFKIKKILELNFGSSFVSTVKNALPRCPDDSEWLRMCKQDSDCIFRDEICAEGKCCPCNFLNIIYF